jgi:hypothetical protein
MCDRYAERKFQVADCFFRLLCAAGCVGLPRGHSQPRSFGHRSQFSREICANDCPSADGASQINFSGIGDRAAAAALTVTYYPEPSITAAVVASTFLISIATDAGGDLLLEFIPSVIHRFPIMRELRIE